MPFIAVFAMMFTQQTVQRPHSPFAPAAAFIHPQMIAPGTEGAVTFTSCEGIQQSATGFEHLK